MFLLRLCLAFPRNVKASVPQQKIAFSVHVGPADDPDAISSDLYVADLTGKHIRLVARKITEWIEHGGGGESAPTASGDDFGWSPDGRWIYFHRLHHSKELTYVISTTGGKERLLTPTGVSDRPDKWIGHDLLAVRRGKEFGDEGRVVILDLRGHSVNKKYWSDDYSPNHRFKLLNQDRDRWTDLDMVDLATRRRTTLAKREEAGFMDVWSPDSKWICVNWGLDDRPVVVNTYTGETIFGYDKRFSGDIFWSPNSQYVTFEPYPYRLDLHSAIPTLDVRSRKTKLVGNQFYELCGWTSDSRNIVAIARTNTQCVVYLLPVSGKPRVILKRTELHSVRGSGYVRYARDNGGE